MVRKHNFTTGLLEWHKFERNRITKIFERQALNRSQPLIVMFRVKPNFKKTPPPPSMTTPTFFAPPKIVFNPSVFPVPIATTQPPVETIPSSLASSHPRPVSSTPTMAVSIPSELEQQALLDNSTISSPKPSKRNKSKNKSVDKSKDKKKKKKKNKRDKREKGAQSQMQQRQGQLIAKITVKPKHKETSSSLTYDPRF